MLNELVVNAFQHAFDEHQEGSISIEIREEDDLLQLNISDSGKGLPSDFDFYGSTSLGMTLVQKLVQQVNGDIEIVNPDESHFHVAFPIRDQKGAHSYKSW